MMATVLKDPRRYFEAVQMCASEAGARPVCLYPGGDQSLQSVVFPSLRTFETLEPPADMSWELFASIVDQVPDVALVVLQVCGDPFR